MVSRDDIAVLLQRKPHAGMDILSVLGRHFCLAATCAHSCLRNATEMIEEKSTFPERIADDVVRFGGSWTFILGFAAAAAI